MGFVSESNNIELNCFFTTKGRAYYLNGNDVDKKIVYFGLGDSDTNYQVGSNSNVLESGFVPNFSGNYDGCLTSAAEGINIKSLINYQPLSSTAVTSTREIRMFSPSTGLYNGKNSLDIKIDLGLYISWLTTYGQYSVNTTDPYNTNQQNLSSPFIKFYDYIGIYNVDTSSIDTTTKCYFSLNQGDYKNYEQLNRFLIDTTIPQNFRTVVPNKSFISSPLEILFTSKNSNNSSLGQGGLMINNRDYVYLVKNYSTNVTTTYTVKEFKNGITLDQSINYDIQPAVILRYTKNKQVIEEIFKLRSDYNSFNGTNLNENNQYLKLFVNDSNKTLVTRECELLVEYITTRSDIFFNSGTKYYTNPITLYLKTDENIKTAALKLSFIYDSAAIYSPVANQTFIS